MTACWRLTYYTKHHCLNKSRKESEREAERELYNNAYKAEVSFRLAFCGFVLRSLMKKPAVNYFAMLQESYVFSI